MKEREMAALAYAYVVNAIADFENKFDEECIVSLPFEITVNENVYIFVKKDEVIMGKQT